MIPRKAFAVVTCSAVGVFACGAGARPTADEVAADILEGTKYRRHAAVANAVAYGDSILEPLRRRSADFTVMPDDSPLAVVEILVTNPSRTTQATLEELARRDSLLPRLVGMAGLALRGLLSVESQGFLMRVAQGAFTTDEETNAKIAFEGKQSISEGTLLVYRSLAIAALGGLGDAAAVETLEGLLLDRDELLYERAARALCRINGQRARAALRHVLDTRQSKARGIALQNLIALGDRDAVGIAIGGIGSPLLSAELLSTLEAVTGQQFGSDSKAWRAWWSAERQRFAPVSAPTCGEHKKP